MSHRVTEGRARAQENARQRHGRPMAPDNGGTAVSNEGPKTAYELAMERLRKKDQEAGLEDRDDLTDAQRAAIAEVRKVSEAKLAERVILHQAKLREAVEPTARAAADEEHRQDCDRIARDRDRKIEKIRRGRS